MMMGLVAGVEANARTRVSMTVVPAGSPGAGWWRPRHRPQCTAPAIPSLRAFDVGGSAFRLTCHSGSAPFKASTMPLCVSAANHTKSGTQWSSVQCAGTRPVATSLKPHPPSTMSATTASRSYTALQARAAKWALVAVSGVAEEAVGTSVAGV